MVQDLSSTDLSYETGILIPGGIKRKYGWEIKEIRQTTDSILEVDCVFYGKQTSFEDERYD